jgi:hypothetical protein
MDTKGKDEQPTQTKADDDVFTVEIATLLDVWHGVRKDRRRSKCIVLSLGDQTGEVRMISIDTPDGWALFQKLAGLFDVGGAPCRRLPHTPKYPVSHSVHRAKQGFGAQGIGGSLRELRKAIPDLADFVEEELHALTRMLPKCRSSKATKRTLNRITRALCVAIDVARIDT